MTRPKFHPIWIIGLLALFAAGALKITLPAGVAASHSDSFTYVDGARNILAGNGFVSGVPPQLPKPVVHFPPFYSMSIAGVGLFFKEIYAAVTCLHLLCFGLTALLAGWLVLAAARDRMDGAIIAILLFSLNTNMMGLFATPLSETVFLPLGLAGLAALVRFGATQKGRFIYLAALLFGLSAITRYSGVVWVAVGGWGIFFLTRPGGWNRVRNSAVYVLLAILPAAMMSVRNHLVGESVANRSLGVHLITWSHFAEGFSTVASWFLPWRFCSWPYGLVVAVILVVVAAAAVLSLWRQRRQGDSVSVPDSLWAIVWICAVFIGVYIAHLILAISFLHQNTLLSQRILAPVQVCALVLMGIGVSRVRGRRARVLQGFCALLILMAGLRAAVTTFHADPALAGGYRGLYWQTNEITLALKALPESAAIYSNRPEAVYLISGRPTRNIPFRYNIMSGRELPQAEAQLQAMHEDLKRSDGVVVFINSAIESDTPYRKKDGEVALLSRLHEFTAEDLQRRFALDRVVENKKATLFRLNGSR